MCVSKNTNMHELTYMITYAITYLYKPRECAVQGGNTLPVTIDQMTTMVCTYDDVKTKFVRLAQSARDEREKQKIVPEWWMETNAIGNLGERINILCTFPTYLNCSRPP